MPTFILPNVFAFTSSGPQSCATRDTLMMERNDPAVSGLSATCLHSACKCYGRLFQELTCPRLQGTTSPQVRFLTLPQRCRCAGHLQVRRAPLLPLRLSEATGGANVSAQQNTGHSVCSFPVEQVIRQKVQTSSPGAESLSQENLKRYFYFRFFWVLSMHSGLPCSPS